MAPSAARIPCRMPPPSKVGPAEHDALTIHSLLPRTISPLVPMSMKRVSFSVQGRPAAVTPATMSPPSQLAGHGMA